MVLEKLMGLTDEEFMDSLMVASNIRKLGRMELLYTCVADLVSFLHRTGMDDLLGGMEHYYDPNDYNRVIYHSKSEDASDRIKQILADADKLLVECEGACDESSAYQLLVRVLKEQTVVEESGARRLKTKEDGAMGSQILQNPSDPDATYREKEGKQNRGYTANIVETIPSILWRKYQIDHMPVRGLLPTKLRFGIKLAALNFKKLFGYLNSVGQCALIPQIS